MKKKNKLLVDEIIIKKSNFIIWNYIVSNLVNFPISGGIYPVKLLFDKFLFKIIKPKIYIYCYYILIYIYI